MWLNYGKHFSEFCKEGKNNPGTLIEVSLGGKTKEFLIGDCGIYGSAMNGDILIPPTETVLRYKIMWYRWRS